MDSRGQTWCLQNRQEGTKPGGAAAPRSGVAEFDSFAIFPCKPEPVTQPHYVEGETAAPWDL